MQPWKKILLVSLCLGALAVGLAWYETAEKARAKEDCASGGYDRRTEFGGACKSIRGTVQHQAREAALKDCASGKYGETTEVFGDIRDCNTIVGTSQHKWDQKGQERAREKALERLHQMQGRQIRCQNFAIDCLENDVRACLDFDRLCSHLVN